MDDCNEFRIDIVGTKEEVLMNSKRFAENYGIKMDGDDKNGTFSGKGVVGEYEVDGDEILVRIIEKTAIMPCSLVKKQMIRSMKGEPSIP